MVGHRLETSWTVDFERHASPERPGAENQVRVSHGMVGMKVRDERSRSRVGWRAVMLPLVAAALARRTTPGPKSTR